MTATTTRARRAGSASDRAAELARVLLDRSGLTVRPPATRQQTLTVLARVLYRWPPPSHDHGRLILEALLPRPDDARSPAEQAIRRLVAAGQAPTPRALVGVFRQTAEAAVAVAERRVRLLPLVNIEGPRAAQAVEVLWRRHGKSPSPTLLRQWLGWTDGDTGRCCTC